MTPGGTVRVYEFEEKFFAHLPGMGDVQVFPARRSGEFSVRVLPGLGLAFAQDAGKVTSVTFVLGDDVVRAARRR